MPSPGTQMHDVSVIKPSSSSVIMWATRHDDKNVHTLSLMVVWRGSDGWHLRDQGANSSGGAAAQWFDYTVRDGGLALNVRFDAVDRIAEIRGRKLALQDRNVILVDGVDSPAGPRVVATLRIDPKVPTASDGYPIIERVWMRSPEIVSFVKR